MPDGSTDSNTMSRHVVVIGGGISGLAAARHLLVQEPEIQVTVIERDTRIGGKVLTYERDGYTIEGGPDSMLGSKPRGTGLSRELGLESRMVTTLERNRGSSVLRNGQLHRIPEGLTGLVPTRLGPIAKTKLISPMGKLRMLGDYVRGPGAARGDETLSDFMTRRLGGEVYTNLIEPLMAGIYAGDGRTLSLDATFPHLHTAEREHGGLIKGVLAQRRKAQLTGGAPKPGFVSFENGLHELIDALAEDLRLRGGEIRTGAAVSLLEPSSRGGYRVTVDRDDGPETRRVDGVIVATQAWAAGPLLETIDHRAATAMEQIPHVSSAIVALGFDNPSVAPLLNGYGYVVPRTEQRRVMAMTFLSSKWPNRAPEGKGLVRAFVGRAGQQELLECPDDRLIEIVRQELRDVLGIVAEPELELVTRWENGMPQYTMGHLDRVATLEAVVDQHDGLAIGGNMFRGVGLPDCIASGERAAEKVASDLAGRSTPLAAAGA